MCCSSAISALHRSRYAIIMVSPPSSARAAGSAASSLRWRSVRSMSLISEHATVWMSRRTASRSHLGDRGPALPGNATAGERDPVERPFTGHPRLDCSVEPLLETAGQFALPCPEIDLGVMTALAGGLYVHATQHPVLVERHDGVGEGAPGLELLLVPAQVDQVLFEGETLRPVASGPY